MLRLRDAVAKYTFLIFFPFSFLLKFSFEILQYKSVTSALSCMF